MKPISPVIAGCSILERVYGANQPEYQGLPAIKLDDGTVCSRWRLTFWERLRVLWFGDVYLWQMTFNSPLQPILLKVERPEVGK